MARKKRVENEAITRILKNTGWEWQLSAGLAGIGALFLGIAATSASWAVLRPFTVHSTQSVALIMSEHQTHAYKETYVGLHEVYFNGGGFITSWSSHADFHCKAVQDLNEHPANNPIWGKLCTAACRSHFQARCARYTEISWVGFVTIGLMLLECSGTIVTVLWTLLFGKNFVLALLFYVVGPLVAATAASSFVISLKEAHSEMRVDSNFPGYTSGYSFDLWLTSVALQLVGGIIICYTHYQEALAIRLIIEQEIIENELGQSKENPMFRPFQVSQQYNGHILNALPPPPSPGVGGSRMGRGFRPREAKPPRFHKASAPAPSSV